MQRHKILAAVLATLCVAGEASLLRRVLVYSYPFKVFTYPSPEFFALAGNVLAPVLVAAFALAAVFLSRRAPVETPLLLAVLLPVVFALALAVVTVVSHGFQVPAPHGNMDGDTIGDVLGEFLLIAVVLSALALLAGGLSSALVALVEPAAGPVEQPRLARLHNRLQGMRAGHAFGRTKGLRAGPASPDPHVVGEESGAGGSRAASTAGE